MPLSRRKAGVVAALASTLALFVAGSVVSPPLANASGAVPVGDGEIGMRAEIDRIHAHFDSVLIELDAHDQASLSIPQRAARRALVRTLQAYNRRGVFPHNYDFADAPTPYFIDRKTGTLCAVAFLLESTGRRDIVDRIARANNNVWVAQLAGDTAVRSWLDRHGITLAEAARIQVPYAVSPVSQSRERALALAAPVTMIASASTGVWNGWGNRDGHNRTGSIIGLSAGVLAAAFNARYAMSPDFNTAARGVASAGVVIGGLGVALSTRSLMRHGRYRASQRESARDTERAQHVTREKPQASISPMLPIGRSTGAGLAVSVRF